MHRNPFSVYIMTRYKVYIGNRTHQSEQSHRWHQNIAIHKHVFNKKEKIYSVVGCNNMYRSSKGWWERCRKRRTSWCCRGLLCLHQDKRCNVDSKEKTMFAEGLYRTRPSVTNDVSDRSHAPHHHHHLDQAENRVRSNAILQFSHEYWCVMSVYLPWIPQSLVDLNSGVETIRI